MVKSYRGVRWTSNVNLARKLGRCDEYVNRMLKKHPDWTVEYIIDMNLDTNPDNHDVKHMYPEKQYRGIAWVNDTQLSHLLGYSKVYVKVCKHKNPNITYEEIIDEALDSRELKHTSHTRYANEDVGYRGYTWRSYSDLSVQLGHPSYYVSALLHYYDGWTVEDVIDHALGVG